MAAAGQRSCTQPRVLLAALVLSQLGGVVEGVWSDSAILASDTVHGLNLAYQGNVQNTEKTYYLYQAGVSYTAKSVMTGTDSFFPLTLPDSLRTKHLTPDSTHPNLAFWFTPDVFERDNIPDGRQVEEWKNVANICYQGHTDTTACTADKKQQLQTGNNKYVEALKQPTETSRPTYKKKMANGHGVVRFERNNRQGTNGKYLEMYKRCEDIGCVNASSAAGFLTDWTNSQSSASSTAFTMFMVVKTNQLTKDTNPHGIINLASSSSSGGFGLYKTEAKCVAAFSGTINVTASTSHLVTLSGGSNVAGTYDGFHFHAGNETVEPRTGLTFTTSSCTVDSYLPSLSVATGSTSATTTSITLSGGAGYLGTWLIQQVDGSWPWIRIGNSINSPSFSDIQISGVSTSSGNTVLTIPSTDFSTTNLVAGTKVFFSFYQDSFNTVILRGCEGASALPVGVSFEIVKPTAPNCETSSFGQLSTVSAYYGGSTDDNGCASECTAGCAPTESTFGSGNTCAKKWGSSRVYENPDSGFKIITVRASGSELKAYVNGLHDGCATADSCSITPPIDISGATPVSLDSLRIGLLDSPGSADSGFASMDLAELMIYDTSLTVQEMDRIGNYLSLKYNIPFTVNTNIRSATRSAPRNFKGGCDSATVTKGHTAPICQQNSANTCAATSSSIPLSFTSADEDTDDVYKGMRISLSKGGDANDGSIKSAAGQTCLVTGYTASTRVATCDLTNAGSYGYVLRSENADFTKGDDALNPLNVSVMVSWAPSWTAPYYAAIGNPGDVRELVKVTAAVVVGIEWKLTLERSLGGSSGSTITESNAKALADVAKITYSRSYLAILNGVYQTGDKAIIVNDILSWTSLPVAYTNLYVKLGGNNKEESISVASATRVTFTLNGTAATASDTPLNIVEATAFNTSILASGDKLRVGDLTTGEIVQLTGTCSSYSCPVTRGVDSTTAAVISAGTTFTLIERGTDFTNPVVLNLNTALVNNYTTTNTILADFAWAPQGVFRSGKNFVGGSAVTYYTLETCDRTNTPFEYDGPIQLTLGNEYLKSPGAWKNPFNADTRTSGNAFWIGANGVPDSSSGGNGRAQEGAWIELRGWYLFPTDMIINSTDTRLNGPQIERNLNYLLVTVGDRDAPCQDPTSMGRCVDQKNTHRETALECGVVSTLTGYCANDYTQACKCTNGDACETDCGTGTTCVAGPPTGLDHNWYYKTKPMLRCQLPASLDSRLDLNIYWHGIKQSLDGWIRHQSPIITGVKPNKVSYVGGDTLTIMGNNFGPADAWSKTSGYSANKMGSVQLRGPSVAVMCMAPAYVSSKQIVCKVPPLPLTRQINYDKAARTVPLRVYVHVGGGSNIVDSRAMFTYDKVPGYFACETKVATSLDKSTCFQCCRSACIVNEFAEGAKRGGTTYTHCDTQCNKYCGLSRVQ